MTYSVYFQGVHVDELDEMDNSVGTIKKSRDCDHMMEFEHDNHTLNRWSCAECDLTIEKPAPIEAETPQRAQILNEAAELIVGDRNKAYGDPEENHQQIADYWTTYLGYPVKAYDVANMMALLKMARNRTSYKRDTYVDLAGYAAIAGELHRNAAERAALSEREG